MQRLLMLAVCITTSLGLVGCQPTTSEGEATTLWREVTNADGSQTRIPHQPQRILSTSVTLTGTLLALDAPLVASATAANGEFFQQWQAEAVRQGVQKAWVAGRVDLEAAMAFAPDLIVVSTGGADSALEHLTALQGIAPTVLLDYGTQSWQDLAVQLGEATGLEERAAARIAEFEQYQQAARQRLNRPVGSVNIVSYNGPGISNPIATPQGAHGQLLTALGFEIEVPNLVWYVSQVAAVDFVRAQYEQLTELTAPTTFLTRVPLHQVQTFIEDPVLVNLPSVQTGQVYGLGENSFRIDYFSSMEIIDTLLEQFAP